MFDLTPTALWERVKVQQAMREKIRAMLGDEGYAAWLRTEDATYAAMRTLALDGVRVLLQEVEPKNTKTAPAVAVEPL